MNNHWNMLTLVGADQPGIVAEVTRVLFGVGAELGEASMMRLGNQFAIMMMVRGAGAPEEIVGAALYLASEAASFTTGTVLSVDGGSSIARM